MIPGEMRITQHKRTHACRYMTSKNSFDRHCSANNLAFILPSGVYNLEAQLNCSGQQKIFLCNAVGEEGRER